MTRLINAMKTDILVQGRNYLYHIGIAFSIATAIILLQIVTTAEQWGEAIPVTMLMVIGGSTLLYVAAMIIFEKDEGTLKAITVSPMTSSEYLTSKVVTLTLLATIESLVLVGVATRFSGFNLPILLIGIIIIGVIYTLFGAVLVVRYDSITDFLVPVLVIAMVLQIPVVYFTGLLDNNLMLLIPTSAPTLLMTGAWLDLAAWQWAYAIIYSAVMMIGLAIWAVRAFNHHIVINMS